MGKELVLRQIVARDENHYLPEIPLPSDKILVLQRYSRAGHVGGTIELRTVEDKIHILGTWGRIKVDRGDEGYKVKVGVGKECEIHLGGKVYLGPDGIYQIQEKV